MHRDGKAVAAARGVAADGIDVRLALVGEARADREAAVAAAAADRLRQDAVGKRAVRPDRADTRYVDRIARTRGAAVAADALRLLDGGGCVVGRLHEQGEGAVAAAAADALRENADRVCALCRDVAGALDIDRARCGAAAAVSADAAHEVRAAVLKRERAREAAVAARAAD